MGKPLLVTHSLTRCRCSCRRSMYSAASSNRFLNFLLKKFHLSKGKSKYIFFTTTHVDVQRSWLRTTEEGKRWFLGKRSLQWCQMTKQSFLWLPKHKIIQALRNTILNASQTFLFRFRVFIQRKKLSEMLSPFAFGFFLSLRHVWAPNYSHF